MELNKTEILLEKYFQGETSIAEENELKHYFSFSNITNELQQYQSLFEYLSNEKQQISRSKLLLKSQKNKLKWWSIAAAILILLGMGTYGILNFDNSNQNQDLGTYDNPEVAFIATHKALSMLSIQINSGFESMKYINEYEYSKNLIFKSY